MSLSTDTALRALVDAAEPLGDARQLQRLQHARQFLTDGLAWVEEALLAAVDGTVDPARSAARHLVQNGGKRVRPTAALLSAACFSGLTPEVRELAVVVELVHSSTLLHDDVIDEGTERRGVPTSRLLYGNAVSVLSGDVLLVEALKRISTSAPALMTDFLGTMTALVSGEVVQLRGRNRVDLSVDTYENILRDKTASLFRFATSSAARLAGATVAEQNAMGAFGERLGMAFQLVDDVLDYSGTKTGKTLCADLREGKVTLPLVLAASRDASLAREIERVHAGDDAAMKRVQRLVIESGSCDEVRDRALDQTEAAIAALEVVAESPARALLIQVAEQLSARNT
jgi:octaprenyl-diphosphate synthase